MPRLSSRQRRTRDVLKTYLQHHTARMKTRLRRNNRSRRNFARAGFTPQDSEQLTALASTTPSFDTLSIDATSDSESELGDSSSISSDVSSAAETSESGPDWSDLLGSDWREPSSGSSSASSTSSSSDASDDDMPELHLAGYPDSDDEDDVSSDSETTSGSDSGDDADDEDGVELEGVGMEEEEHDFPGRRANHPLRWMARDTFPVAPRSYVMLLALADALKNTRPDLRVSLFTFDQLVNKIANDPVFANNSFNAQMPVEDQLAISLYRFGHSGNAASLQKVANWAGVGKGTVTLATRRVMTVILRPDFMADVVRMPTASEKERAKAWVEAHSCKAWRNSWSMVDGTLVALFDRPYWFGESYFDRKCNYSSTCLMAATAYHTCDCVT
ncbi:hypothetical protein GGX14DRAFT_535427 [Mycena pura]|uniref:Uncharacterized protein n=1 Tax=Mycena pura TaxID=153505 RepID=A0AAD6VAU1_9AGAR|nr:hypothetical protein GGX14DRAFT_535427 [Mycena pura]